MRNQVLIFVGILFTLVTGCKKQTTVYNDRYRYIYEVKQQELYQSASEKRNLKTTTQFISISYNDLFGASITNNELTQFDIALQSFGDKNILHDMIVKSLINRSTTIIPTDQAMRADIPTFVNQTYLRFYNRKPNEFEAWKMKDLITKNTDITAKMVFYSLMTSEEYQYY